MSKEDKDILSQDEIRFCPKCGYEGTDLICPVCPGQEKMESLSAEVDRISKIEEQKELIDDHLSLEAEADNEHEKINKDDESEIEDI